MRCKIWLNPKLLFHGAMSHASCLAFFGMTTSCVSCLVATKIIVTAQRRPQQLLLQWSLQGILFHAIFVQLFLHKILHNIRYLTSTILHEIELLQSNSRKKHFETNVKFWFYFFSSSLCKFCEYLVNVWSWIEVIQDGKSICCTISQIGCSHKVCCCFYL